MPSYNTRAPSGGFSGPRNSNPRKKTTEEQDILYDAIVKNDPKAIEEAIKDGGDVNGDVNWEGYLTTPLYAAVSKNCSNAVIALLKLGAEVDKPSWLHKEHDKYNRITPLSRAALLGRKEIAKICLLLMLI
jgi:ankyrin repeat protein